MTGPAIHSICVVKNEADIIGHCLERALDWSAHVIVLDNGSTDGTWDIVRALAKAHPSIIPWKQDDAPFRESLRGDVFNAFRHLARPGDWWCRLDADEFYVQDPRTFLARVRPRHHVVWAIAVEYYLTPADVEQVDFSRPAPELLAQLRHYRAEHSEQRFFRYRPRLRWGPMGSWPHHVGISAPERILYQHYQYRSPEQIQRRLDTRRAAIAMGFPGWGHAKEADWRLKVVPEDDVFVDAKDGTFTILRDRLPDHLGTLPRRALKHLLHGVGVWP